MKNVTKALMAMLAAGFVFAAPAKAYEDEGCPYRVSGVAYNDVLNIRLWPSPRSRIVGFIPPNGEDVQLIRRKGNWGLIYYNGGEGWSHMRYLRRDCY